MSGSSVRIWAHWSIASCSYVAFDVSARSMPGASVKLGDEDVDTVLKMLGEYTSKLGDACRAYDRLRAGAYAQVFGGLLGSLVFFVIVVWRGFSQAADALATTGFSILFKT